MTDEEIEKRFERIEKMNDAQFCITMCCAIILTFLVFVVCFKHESRINEVLNGMEKFLKQKL